MESLHKSKSVIASAAKQSILACESCTYGSSRGCAPRDDGRMQNFPRVNTIRCLESWSILVIYRRSNWAVFTVAPQNGQTTDSGKEYSLIPQ